MWLTTVAKMPDQNAIHRNRYLQEVMDSFCIEFRKKSIKFESRCTILNTNSENYRNFDGFLCLATESGISILSYFFPPLPSSHIFSNNFTIIRILSIKVRISIYNATLVQTWPGCEKNINNHQLHFVLSRTFTNASQDCCASCICCKQLNWNGGVSRNDCGSGKARFPKFSPSAPERCSMEFTICWRRIPHSFY